MTQKRSGLEGAGILMVEDEYYLADDLASAFARWGRLCNCSIEVEAP